MNSGRLGTSMQERQRILRAYEARQIRVQGTYFVYECPAHNVRIQECHRETLRLLAAHKYHPLSDLRILDVGCGDGNMLRQFLQWGAMAETLSGIDLRQEPVAYARAGEIQTCISDVGRRRG